MLRLTRKAPGPPLGAIAPARKPKLDRAEAAAFDRVVEAGSAAPVDATDAAAAAALAAEAGEALGAGLPAVLVVDGVLSEAACATLIKAADACASRSFWAGADDAESRAFRDADTIEVACPALAAAAWAKLAQFFEDDARVDVASTERVETRGRWRPDGLNDDFLFGTYPRPSGKCWSFIVVERGSPTLQNVDAGSPTLQESTLAVRGCKTRRRRSDAATSRGRQSDAARTGSLTPQK